MKKLILFAVLGLLLGACTTLKPTNKLSTMSEAEKAIERQNQRR